MLKKEIQLSNSSSIFSELQSYTRIKSDSPNMAEYDIEGDITGITERQLEFIHNVLIDHGFNGNKVTFEPVGVAGDNYTSNVKRIIIESEDGPVKIIAKVASSNEMIWQTNNTHILFKNEHLMYKELLPKFTELQRREQVSEDDLLKYAKCYGSLCEESNEVILLEDLTSSNFTMLSRFESLSDTCVKSVLKNFATLHSLSYVLKTKEPETYEYFTENLSEMWTLPATRERMAFYFQQMENDLLTLLNDEEHKNAVRHKLSNLLNMADKITKSDKGSRFNVIQQGDSWTNNIMFRIQDGNKVDSIMIDYQLSKESSPVCDLLYMIFNCTDYEIRSKHFHEWIEYYHSELDRSLSNFGMKSSFVYPLDQLEADLKRYGKVFFGFSMLLAGVLTIKPEDAEKAKEAMDNVDTSQKAADADPETTARMKNRVVELIKSFKEFGLL